MGAKTIQKKDENVGWMFILDIRFWMGKQSVKRKMG